MLMVKNRSRKMLGIGMIITMRMHMAANPIATSVLLEIKEKNPFSWVAWAADIGCDISVLLVE